MRLSFTTLFKLLFKLISDYSSFSELIITNEVFSSFVIKSFFVSTTISIKFMSSRVINKVFIKLSLKFSSKVTTCHDFFHFILDEIKDFFKIFRDRSYVLIVHFKKWRVKSLLLLINRSHSLHAKRFNILNNNFDIKNWNRLKIELIWR